MSLFHRYNNRNQKVIKGEVLMVTTAIGLFVLSLVGLINHGFTTFLLFTGINILVMTFLAFLKDHG